MQAPSVGLKRARKDNMEGICRRANRPPTKHKSGVTSFLGLRHILLPQSLQQNVLYARPLLEILNHFKNKKGAHGE